MKHKHNDNLDYLNDLLLPPAPDMSPTELWAFNSRHQDNPLLHYLNHKSHNCCWSLTEATAILYALENDANMTPFECSEFMQSYIIQPIQPGPLKLLDPASVIIRQIKERGKRTH